MTTSISITVNGQSVQRDISARTLLSDLLRDHLGLTGTHRGCDTAQCGACTVHVDDRAVKSCSVLALQVQGTEVTTIEGLGGAQMHPMQQAFKDQHGLQCGFCTPGMVMSAVDLVRRYPHADERKVRKELNGNLCRCTGYQNIVQAVLQGATAMAEIAKTR